VAFDVVSIKPNQSGNPGRFSISPSGRIEWPNATLRELLTDVRETLDGGDAPIAQSPDDPTTEDPERHG
jgi:hypothetical protein